jgi:chromosome segregation ATPase
MAESDEPDPRVAELERQVRELDRRVRSSAQDAAAARILAGGADRDVAEIRGEIRDFRQATTSSFNAMRADFTDLRQGFTDLRQEFADVRQQMNDKFDAVDRGFIEMRGRFDATAAGQQHIVDLLTTIMNEQGGDT